MLYSRDGQLHVDLVAAPDTYAIGGHQFQRMLFNGQYMPPVWHLYWYLEDRLYQRKLQLLKTDA